jgi:hypothetical protein
MVAAKPDIIANHQVCVACKGTGIIAHWSEFSCFEDRQICHRCDSGRAVDANIAEIIRRAQAEKRPFRLYEN